MNKFILAPYVRTGFLNGELHFGFGSLRKIITQADLQTTLLDACLILRYPTTIPELNKMLLAKGYNQEIIYSALEILKDKFIIPNTQYDKNSRHSRSHLFYSISGGDIKTVHEKISKKHVAIVGCGGIGNLIAPVLATSGINEFTLVDNDKIEASNLNRQFMFTESDVGRFKVDCLANALKLRNSSVTTHTVKEFITNENCKLLDTCDFIVISGDQGSVVDIINRYSVRTNKPSINVGYVEDIAVWGPMIIPGSTGCYHCQEHLVNEKGIAPQVQEKCKLINNQYQSPSNGPINMLASSLAALDIIKVLGEFGNPQSLNKRIGLWSHDLHFEIQDFTLNPNCRSCGSLNRVEVDVTS